MITIVCGDNAGEVNKFVRSRIAEFVDANGDLALERLEGEPLDYDSLHNSLTSLPFLSNSKMVIVRRLSENKELSERIEEILGLSDESTDLLLVEGHPDKRKAYYKILKKQPGFHEFGTLKGPQLLNWVINEARNIGAKLSPGEARFLIERIGEDQTLLAAEVEKLAIYNSDISRQTIELLTESTPENNIFELISNAFNSRHGHALDLYEQQRSLKVEPYQILSMFTWQLHQVALAKTSGASSGAELASGYGLSPFSADKAVSLARLKSLKDLQRLASQITEIEYRTKTSSYDIDEAIRTLIVSM